MYTQIYEIDIEFMKYLQTRYFKWIVSLDSTDTSKVNLEILDGSNANVPAQYVPVIFRYSNIYEKQLTVETILRQNPKLTYPFILVSPLDEEDLRETMPYTDTESTFDKDTDIASQHRAIRRVAFQYQIEGISDSWIDHRILKDLLYYKMVEDDYNQQYINLFGINHTVKMDPITQNVEEDSNKFRAIQTIKIETSLYSTKPVDYLRILSFIVNTNTFVEGN